MEEYVLGTMETRFAEMIWEAAPITTGELIKRCDAAFGWKRLCVRGLFQLQDGLVTVLVTRSEFQAARSERFVEETFGGSLPALIATFTRNRRLSKQEVDAIQRLIDESRKGES